MTDEEMTDEEMADQYIQNDAVFVNNKVTIKSVKQAFLAGLKAGKEIEKEVDQLQKLLLEASKQNMNNLYTIRELTTENMELQQKCIEYRYRLDNIV
jgi:hypothetical protein